MGDTGSLVIGLVLGLLTLRLMSFEDEAFVFLSFNRAQLPLFLITVLFVPLLDTLRVMLVRILNRVSIFKPDRNHIHHIIIDFGLSHRRASFFIGICNFFAALLMFFVIQLFDFMGSFIVLIAMFLLAILVLFLMNKNKAAIRLKVKIRQSLLRLL
jgi:UDP-N-acetylmuramyl pentapeptide phosphotransferase/UDP-N-acetylglucosamine-1-phosphate transferase